MNLKMDRFMNKTTGTRTDSSLKKTNLSQWKQKVTGKRSTGSWR